MDPNRQPSRGVRPEYNYNEETLLATDELCNRLQTSKATDLIGNLQAHAHGRESNHRTREHLLVPPPRRIVNQKVVEEFDYKTNYWQDEVVRRVEGGWVFREEVSGVGASDEGEMEQQQAARKGPIVKYVRPRNNSDMPDVGQQGGPKGSAQSALIGALRGGHEMERKRRRDSKRADDVDEEMLDVLDTPSKKRGSDETVSATTSPAKHNQSERRTRSSIPPNPYSAPAAPMGQSPSAGMLPLDEISELSDVSDEVKALVKNLRNAKKFGNFPSRTLLRKESWAFDHFDRALGRLREGSSLRDYTGDLRLFDEEWWSYLVGE